MNSHTEDNKGAVFQSDPFVACGCCLLLWLGPFLPLLAEVLPFHRYMLLQLLFDLSEFAAVAYTGTLYGFKESSRVLWWANLLFSGIDFGFFKGPPFVYEVVGMCYNPNPFESGDVEAPGASRGTAPGGAPEDLMHLLPPEKTAPPQAPVECSPRAVPFGRWAAKFVMGRRGSS